MDDRERLYLGWFEPQTLDEARELEAAILRAPDPFDHHHHLGFVRCALHQRDLEVWARATPAILAWRARYEPRLTSGVLDDLERRLEAIERDPGAPDQQVEIQLVRFALRPRHYIPAAELSERVEALLSRVNRVSNRLVFDLGYEPVGGDDLGSLPLWRDAHPFADWAEEDEVLARMRQWRERYRPLITSETLGQLEQRFERVLASPSHPSIALELRLIRFALRPHDRRVPEELRERVDALCARVMALENARSRMGLRQQFSDDSAVYTEFASDPWIEWPDLPSLNRRT